MKPALIRSMILAVIFVMIILVEKEYKRYTDYQANVLFNSQTLRERLVLQAPDTLNDLPSDRFSYQRMVESDPAFRQAQAVQDPQKIDYQIVTDTEKTPFVPGLALVNLPGTEGSCPSTGQLRQKLGIPFNQKVKRVAGSCSFTISVSPGTEVAKISEWRAEAPLGVFIELNFVANPWSVDDNEQLAAVSRKLGSENGQRLPVGKQLLVAILDSGIDSNHKDLKDKVWTNPKEIPGNGIDDDNNGWKDDVHGWNSYNNNNNPFDMVGHGTHVAGIVSKTGGSDQIKIVALKVGDLNPPNTMAVAAAIYYAIKNNIPLLNMSFGFSAYSKILERAVEEADKAGLLIVAATGNKNFNNDEQPNYPASFRLPNVISVMALDSEDRKRESSDYGKLTVDIGSLGEGIVSTVPSGACQYCSDTGYAVHSGTSVAAPYVTGILAAGLLTLDSPQKEYLRAKDSLLSSVSKLAALNGLSTTGGKINPSLFFKKLKEPVSPSKNTGLTPLRKSFLRGLFK